MIVVSQFVQSMLGDNPDNPEVIIAFSNQRAVEFTSRVSINSFNKLTHIYCFGQKENLNNQQRNIIDKEKQHIFNVFSLTVFLHCALSSPQIYRRTLHLMFSA